MKFLLSGYYGFGNAGDEAVLAAILDALGSRVPSGTEYIVTAGDPERTIAMHSTPSHRVIVVPRQHPRLLLQAIKACDVFISGGGSLLQDVTSLRNVVYYTSLMRWARLARKPLMVYAQGVGPLRKPMSRKLSRVAMQGAKILTVRDADSQTLLRSIGVRREIEVTADPVWALDCTNQAGRDSNGSQSSKQNVWCVSLRSWPNVTNEAEHAAGAFKQVCDAARAANARLRFLPMQPSSDGPLIEEQFHKFADATQDEIIDTSRLHPGAVMAEAGRCNLMLAMRLHALIFAAAQGVPCVAINYDPKVAVLAKMIGAPVLEREDFTASSGGTLAAAVAAAKPADPNLLAALKSKALHNADLAASLL